jgi:hypothetical protein
MSVFFCISSKKRPPKPSGQRALSQLIRAFGLAGRGQDFVKLNVDTCWNRSRLGGGCYFLGTTE